MTRAVARAFATAVLGALLGPAFLAVGFIAQPRLEISFDTDPPKLVSGAFPSERDPEGLTFAWTGRELALRLPGLDRNVDWTLEMRVRGARPLQADNPVLSFVADGDLRSTVPTRTDYETIRVTIPARPERRRGVVISMQASKTFVPGPGDPRALGVMVDRLSLTPDGVALPPRRAFAGVSMSAAVLGAAVALLGVTTGSAVGAAVLLSAGASALVARGFGPYTNYPVVVAWAALWIALALTVSVRAVEISRRQRLRNTARFVAAFSAGAMFLKLLLLLHPDMPVGDAMFHAHRFQGVLGGQIYFTSIAPGNYLFPYAPGFYLFASAFADLVARGAPDMALLRATALAADTIAAALLYLVIVRRWSDRMTGAVAVAAYHLVPLDLRIMTVGNLTNAFAQSLSVVALVLFGSAWVRWENRTSVLCLGLVLAAAFMSHTSTFAILGFTAVLVAVLFAWPGGSALRSPAAAVITAAIVALLVSIAVYYGHFGEVYRTELARIGTETATAAPDAGGRGIIARAASVPGYLHAYLGAPALLLAAAGAWHLLRRQARDRLTLAVAGWALSCAVFLMVGVLTPVDMRYYLASIPAVALVAAVGASTLWSGGRAPRVVSVVLLAWMTGVGIVTWWTTL